MKPKESPASVPTVFSKNRIVLGIGLVIILALAIYRMGHRQQPKELPIYGIVPDFSLTRQNGNTLLKADLLGHPWIADFIFTRCAGQCPAMSTTMAGLQSELRSLEDLRFVSFSVDPKWDTPAVLAKYSQRFGADPKRWTFVTGPKDDVFRISRQGFKLGVDENPPDAPNIAVEPIMHSSSLVLVDAKGKIRGYYDGTDPEALTRLRTDVLRISGPQN